MIRNRHYPSEDSFRRHFELECRAIGARYTQTPDVHRAAYAVAKGARTRVPAHKRPCDGVFETCDGLAWIELKIQNNRLEKHQVEHLLWSERKNGAAFVLRAKETVRDGLVYTVERSDGAVWFKASEIRDIIYFIAERLQMTM